jgi:hypothetical protein
VEGYQRFAAAPAGLRIDIIGDWDAQTFAIMRGDHLTARDEFLWFSMSAPNAVTTRYPSGRRPHPRLDRRHGLLYFLFGGVGFLGLIAARFLLASRFASARQRG